MNALLQITQAVLIKPEAGGFAYGPYEKTIKLRIRPAQNGWFFEERAGTKGGALDKVPTITVTDEAAAHAMLADRITKEEANGYRVVSSC